jgi:cytochrome c oxidase subunit 3
MADASHGRKHPPSGPDAHLAHHFDTARQQFSAGRLGMWLFIATEILMFGGLFCAYAILRGNHPDIFEFGSQFLDRRWGFLNTVVLVSSSFTMALAVRAAACGHQRQLVLFLTLTLICGVDFMVVKYLEYSHKFEEHLVWGAGFYEGHHAMVAAEEAVAVGPGDAAHGSTLFGATCAACHGPGAEGMEGLGPTLVANQFVAGLDEAGLVQFLRAGRSLDDPRNTTGLLMPPKGGNPLLSMQDLADIAAHLRGLQTGVGGAVVAAAAATPAEPPAVAAEQALPRSVIPLAAPAPVGLDPRGPTPPRRAGFAIAEPPGPTDLPPNAHLFFGIYFCMTGLHGVHVLVGIGVIGWLRKRALRGDFSSSYYTPVDFVGLYWHVVDIIWIFLFPLFYLI